MLIKKLMSLLLAASLVAGLAGCGSAPVVPPPQVAPPVPERSETPDHLRLKEALTGPGLSPGEVADLSDRLLAVGSFISEQDMARLELVLLKSLKSQDKTYRATFWRNLGIIHYSQKKYKQARQELQASNELNPKNGRTHFYLAKLFSNEGKIYESQGKKSKARQQFKRAAIEMEMARKLEPSNPLYRQDVRQ
ncbi:MAG: tetratricopeptide repeat protein [Deltaproteobacteria bacterium]|nr:tetratricopeptide repeat protein [Deltaproteobacteria bacterium]